MTYKELDFIFPFVVLDYGAIMTFLLNSPKIMQFAEEKLSHELLQQMKMHRGLGLICLTVGAIWSLQNLWYR